MNAGGGEAADQLVRMILAGSETTVRLGGDALKNLLALSMALAKDHKKLYGKVNMRKMLNETRDIRVFTMTPEQYKQFRKLAGKQKILFSAIKDSDGHGLVDVVLPVTELERANTVFERIKYNGKSESSQEIDDFSIKKPSAEQSQSEQNHPESFTPERRNAEQKTQGKSEETPDKTTSKTKDESRSQPDSPDIKISSDISREKKTSRTTTTNRSQKSNRPSVEERLKTYQTQIRQNASAPTRSKTKSKVRVKNRSKNR